MGLFKKKHNDDNDFILDFDTLSDGGYVSSTKEQDGELGITPWDKREHISSPHAMTVDEILGADTQITDTEKEADEPQIELPISDETLKEFGNEPVAEEVKESQKAEINEEETPDDSIVVPKDDTPMFDTADGHVDTDIVFTDIPDTAEIVNEKEDTPAKEAEAKPVAKEPQKPVIDEAEPPDLEDENARKMVEEIKEQSIRNYVTDKSDENISDTFQIPESAANEPPVKKEIKLSPMAQEIYDRMMAERAKAALTRTGDETPEISAKPDDTVINDEAAVMPEEKPIDLTPPTITEPVEESVADAIFDSISVSLSDNPLKGAHVIGDSLMDKCRNFVKKESEGKEETVDDIIHDAEQSARKRLFGKRLANNSVNETPQKATEKEGYDFGLFGGENAKEFEKAEDVTRVINLSETSSKDVGMLLDAKKEASVKNLQYSLADRDIPKNIAATRTIPLNSDEANSIELNGESGHKTDPAKVEEIKLHLKKIAEKDPTAEIPHLNFMGDEEEELPDNDTKDYLSEAPTLDDYKSVEDAESVNTDLSAKKVSLTARLIPTFAITAILFIIDYAFKDILASASVGAYTWLNFILLSAAILININTVKGLGSLIMGVPDMDTPCAVSVGASYLYTLIVLISGKTVALPILTPIAALTLLFNLFAKRSILKRIQRGFKVIANENQKNAVTFVEDNLSASVMANGSVIGEALICEGRPTTNITDYLKNVYSEDLFERKLTPLSVFTLVSAAVISVIGFFAGGGIYDVLFAFALVLAAACPPSMLLCCNLPLSLASKKLKSYGAMSAGYGATETIANANAVAFNASSLFPQGTIQLYNMQVLNPGAVDKYIASAAAVLTAAKSPLAPIFGEILETNDEEIPTADSIKYENNMGLSGWIGEHRIFVGNRTLIEGHGIQAPSLELDKKVLRKGFFPVYLAVDQTLCALFVIGYSADEEITYELRSLCNLGVTMLVNTNDPNITDEMLCDYFGLYKDSIKVMTSSGVTAYKAAGAYKESVSAPASYNDDVCGLLSIVSSSIKTKSTISALLIMQIVLVCLGVAGSLYLALTASLLTLPSVIVAAAHLAATGITAAVAYFRRP